MSKDESADPQQLNARVDEMREQLKVIENRMEELRRAVTGTNRLSTVFQTEILRDERSNWVIDSVVNQASDAYLKSGQFKLLKVMATVLALAAAVLTGYGTYAFHGQVESLPAGPAGAYLNPV